MRFVNNRTRNTEIPQGLQRVFVIVLEGKGQLIHILLKFSRFELFQASLTMCRSTVDIRTAMVL